MRKKRPERKTFPINAMLEGRKVLVVGGGRVGQRKVELLLDAGASVTLVCPDCVSELNDLEKASKITHLKRFFEDRDVDQSSLVFACTDNKHVNRRILELSKAARVLCCCADGNWPDGDFVTPAILRTGKVLMSVSTSGKSCRQSRLIKENLSKHLNSIESSDLLVIGTSHEMIGMQERAPYHLLLREREVMGAMISQVWGVHEFFILNTCNRIELVAAIAKEATTSGVLRRLMHFDQLRPDLYYMKFGYQAFEHVCKITAGMGSQTPGEFHVVSQVKDAVEEASACGWAASIIRDLCDTVLKVSKDIRRQVEPLLDIAEIEEVCIRYIDQHIDNLSDKRVFVAGTGVVGKGLISSLVKRDVKCVWGYHRNMPKDFDSNLVEIVQFDQIGNILSDVDIVVSAVDVESPLINVRGHLASVKKDTPVTMIDLGMPRNIDPELGTKCNNIKVIDLDVLKHWYRKSTGTLNQVLKICADITESNRDKYERIRNSMQGEL
ncbi:MAG: hypothetical protein PF904_15995 [Kiritimatiellae bacterium]|jgi:glutamyl-tRNA reductase|nr:hypothetical protein [Kiritimatiellia bacterium]